MKLPLPLLPLAAMLTAARLAGDLTSQELATVLQSAIGNGQLQAVSVGLIQSGGTVSLHAGTLSPDDARAPDDDTLYEIGSLTKVFTSLLLAEAVVRGEVTLDTPIATLLPEDVALPGDAGNRITLRMLATHTSGLPRIPETLPTDDYTNPYQAYGDADLWQTLRTVKLDFETGSKASYSNLGAGLLGTLLARKAGTDFEQLLARRITGPLNMHDTTVTISEAQRDHFARGFTSTGTPAEHWDFQALAGAGAIRSTLPDLLRFAEAVLKPEGTSLEKAIDLAWQVQDGPSLSAGGQALGWLIAGDKETRWHNGTTGGFHAVMFVNRRFGIATVLLANRSTPVGSQIAEELTRRAAGQSVAPNPNRDRPDIALSLEQLDRCTGTFRFSPNFALDIERRNRALFITPTGQPTDRLYAASPTTFFSRRVAAELVFEFADTSAPATAVVLKQGGREARAERE